MLVTTVFLAFLFDCFFGEPKRYHPLVGFGLLVNKIEAVLNDSQGDPSEEQALHRFLLGAVGWGLLVIIPTVLVIVLLAILESFFLWLLNADIGWVLNAIVLYLAVGYTSLRQHALAVLTPLYQNHLASAREQVGRIVSRDTDQLDAEGVRKATIESVLENGSDAIFAPLFWFVVGGVPGVIIYRLTNTLDAMWGYKTERFLLFGRFSAKMDDVLNWVPSRLVGLSYSILGKTRQALYCWLKQAHLLESPNGGVVMTAGAGALSVLLGGNGIYSGELKQKPLFGYGNAPSNNDILSSLSLITKTLLLWLVLIAAFDYFFSGWL